MVSGPLSSRDMMADARVWSSLEERVSRETRKNRGSDGMWYVSRMGDVHGQEQSKWVKEALSKAQREHGAVPLPQKYECYNAKKRAVVIRVTLLMWPVINGQTHPPDLKTS